MPITGSTTRSCGSTKKALTKRPRQPTSGSPARAPAGPPPRTVRDPDGHQGLGRRQGVLDPGWKRRLRGQHRARGRDDRREPPRPGNGPDGPDDLLGILGLDDGHLRRQCLEPDLHPRWFQPGLGLRRRGAARGSLHRRGDRRLDLISVRDQRRFGDQALVGDGLDRRTDAAEPRLRRARADRPAAVGTGR